MKVMLFESIDEAKSLIPERKLKRVDVGQLTLCITRIGDQFFAMKDLCPHLGARLSNGNLNPYNEVVCPLHAYRFHLETGNEALGRCRESDLLLVSASNNQLWLSDSEESNH